MNAVVSDADRARQILAGTSMPPLEVLGIAKALKRQREFSLVRRLLEQLGDDPAVRANAALRIEVARMLALATYKDSDLQNDWKFGRAIEVLASAFDIETTRDQEVLGLLGAICKRKWEWNGRETELVTSANFYLRGSEQGAQNDNGYTGINAAFILDLLSEVESPAPGAAGNGKRDVAEERQQQARALRETIIRELNLLLTKKPALSQDWWHQVTLGEAYFGIGDFINADRAFSLAAKVENVPDWERETSARQLAKLKWIMEERARRKGEAPNPQARVVLERFLGDAAPALDSIERGKMGIALSGGGFRASLYHIGVLARLAELDLLRGVECLSCVSGGSIIGAHYYLEVRKLLESKTDAEIGPDDYVRIVERVAEQFLAGIQRNIRTRVAAEWLTNVKMMFAPDYSRTMRVGELYESEIFARVDDGRGKSPRWLDELTVAPKGDPGFRPKDHNWRRRAKVPVLILNATTLNTGHNWQFTATWMGEPPAGISSEVDANYWLRRMYYTEAPEPHKRVRLGYAVAASACVPGLFEPLPLPNLYEKGSAPGPARRPVVRLVDGGVYDNQGTSALLEQGCSVLIVSDASGQMDVQEAPSNGLLGVPLRANSILQARVRVSQFEALDGLRRGGLLKGFMFVHLKKGLDSVPVDWVHCQDPSRPPKLSPVAPFGIQKSVQRQLAAIRTDLDSFSEVEAFALMASGYFMTHWALRSPVLGFPAPEAPRRQWKFMEIERFLTQPDAPLLTRQLGVAGKLAFKVWLLMRRLQVLGGVFVLIAIFFAVVTLRDSWALEIRTTVGRLVFSIACAAATLAGLGLISRVIKYRKSVQDLLIGLGMSVAGFAFARLHLHVFDRIFLWQGKVKRL